MLDILPGDSGHLFLACTATFAAGLIRGFAGFGSGMIMVAVLLSLYPPMLAMPTVLFTELVLSLVMLPAAMRHIRWQLILPMAMAAALVAPLGVWCLGVLTQELARWLASAMILAFVALALLRKSRPGDSLGSRGGFALTLTAGTRQARPRHAPVPARAGPGRCRQSGRSCSGSARQS